MGRAKKHRTVYPRSEQSRLLAPEQWDALVTAQGGRCAICGDDERDLHIDHDHKTGKVRGLLCESCNTGLGFFKDNPGNLRGAILYLMKHTPGRQSKYWLPEKIFASH